MIGPGISALAAPAKAPVDHGCSLSKNSFRVLRPANLHQINALSKPKMQSLSRAPVQHAHRAQPDSFAIVLQHTWRMAPITN
jgi:hypothetical protein